MSLTRHTFGLSWPATLYGAWLVLRANQLWAPPVDNDPEGARRAMERFYRLVKVKHHERYDPVVASRLEVEWWRVHRVHQRSDNDLDEQALVDALTALYAYVYQVPADDGAPCRRAARAGHALLRPVGVRGLLDGQPAGGPGARRAGALIRGAAAAVHVP